MKLKRREIVKLERLGDSSIDVKYGNLSIDLNEFLYKAPTEKISESFSVMGNDLKVSEDHFDVASALSKEANIEKFQGAEEAISKAFDWIGSGNPELQLEVLANRIKARKESKYTILNKVSVQLDEENRIYVYPNYPEFDLNLPVDWAYAEPPFDKRSWRYGLNAWVFMDALLESETLENIRYAKDIAIDWINYNVFERRENQFAWYDMGVAFRATRLPFIIERCLRHNLINAEELGLLSHALTLHILDLTSKDKYASHSNHGLYQLCGLLAVANILPEAKGSHLLDAYAEREMFRMLEKDVSSEGVHKEHSPDYHVYISDIVFAAINAGWVLDSRIIAIANKMNSVNAFLLHPDNNAVRFGDTSERDFRSLLNKDVPELFYVYRNGKEGAEPKKNSLILPESGYAFFREHWNRKNWYESSFFAYSAAFHKRTHKHADDFNFEWYDRGARILIDAGKYGYEKEAIERKYIESTRAHNCVVIDGQDYSRYNHDIFGSAITAWADSEIKVVESFIYRKRFFNVAHRRIIFFKPKEFLLVVDHLQGKETHDYCQWFHFNPDIDVINSLDKTYADLEGARLWINSFGEGEKVELIKAQFEPELQGWTSQEAYKLTPNYALGMSKANSDEHTFATLFSFGDEASEPIIENFKSTSNGKYLRLKWTDTFGNSQDFVYRVKDNERDLSVNGADVFVEVKNENS